MPIQFKLFLYLSDVNASCGPYQYVRGSHASMGPLSLPKDGENYDAADVEGAYPAADRTSVVGPAGTVFAAADAVLHRAAPLSGGPGTHRVRSLERSFLFVQNEKPSHFQHF